MVRIKSKELRAMASEERTGKLGELKLELVKSKAVGSKSGSSKTREIKRLIARILTLEAVKEKR